MRARSQTNGCDPYRWLYRAAINNLVEKPAIRDSSKTNRSSSRLSFPQLDVTAICCLPAAGFTFHHRKEFRVSPPTDRPASFERYREIIEPSLFPPLVDREERREQLVLELFLPASRPPVAVLNVVGQRRFPSRRSSSCVPFRMTRSEYYTLPHK